MFGWNKKEENEFNYDFFGKTYTGEGVFTLKSIEDTNSNELDVVKKQGQFIHKTIVTDGAGQEAILYIFTSLEATHEFYKKHNIEYIGGLVRIINTKLKVKYYQIDENVYIVRIDNIDIEFNDRIDMKGRVIGYRINELKRFEYDVIVQFIPEVPIENIQEYNLIKVGKLLNGDECYEITLDKEDRCSEMRNLVPGALITISLEKNNKSLINKEIYNDEIRNAAIIELYEIENEVIFIVQDPSLNKYSISISSEDICKSYLAQNLRFRDTIEIYTNLGEVSFSSSSGKRYYKAAIKRI